MGLKPIYFHSRLRHPVEVPPVIAVVVVFLMRGISLTILPLGKNQTPNGIVPTNNQPLNDVILIFWETVYCYNGRLID
jgi:hypothetical protein